jgi:FKBP-type peptidyl-prolyl cis-trans isomerase FklB
MQSEISYALGLLLANSLRNQVNTEDIDKEDFMKGFWAMFYGQEVTMQPEEASGLADKYIRQVTTKKAMEMIELEKNFLVDNAKRLGVITTPSGLQYEIITEGTGRIPRQQNKVMAHYEGKLVSGKVFDSSYRRGQPATFPVGGLIQGWQEALQLMPTGSKWRLFIPSHLGYGAKGAGADIPANATLIFELELLSIV